MKAILQRCQSATVSVENKPVGECQKGLMILLGVAKGDTTTDAELLANKIAKLRIFDDPDGKLNLSVKDISGSILVVSNFTLMADYRKGNRPDYFGAEAPAEADRLYQYFAACLRDLGIHTETGEFGADMKINIVCDGPVTIDMDSNMLKKTS